MPMALSAHSERLCLPAQDLVDQRELGGGGGRLERAMEVLPPRYREVMRRVYGIGGEVSRRRQIVAGDRFLP
jgi:hypothetical protein